MRKIVLLIISGLFAIVVGLGILGIWLMLYFTHQIPEFKTEPVAIAFHITAESIMGILSLLSGIFLILGQAWALYLFILSMGLVIYAVINAAGYYGQKKQWSMVIMFGIILLASVSLVILNIYSLVFDFLGN